MNPHGTLFQIGRLLFPELINRHRALRRRMTLLSAALGLLMVATTVVFLMKVYDREGRALPVYAKPLPPPRQ